MQITDYKVDANELESVRQPSPLSCRVKEEEEEQEDVAVRVEGEAHLRGMNCRAHPAQNGAPLFSGRAISTPSTRTHKLRLTSAGKCRAMGMH